MIKSGKTLQSGSRSQERRFKAQGLGQCCECGGWSEDAVARTKAVELLWCDACAAEADEAEAEKAEEDYWYGEFDEYQDGRDDLAAAYLAEY